MTPDLRAPWLAPYRDIVGNDICSRDIASHLGAAADGKQPVDQQLNALLAGQPDIRLGAGALRFVDQAELPAGEAYESFIARTAAVPTRDTLHDLCNGLVWLRFPRLKRHLNALHAGQIARAGIGATRGRVRDALTLFDENAALWQAPAPLAAALKAHDWLALFQTHRALWRGAEPLLFGHALIEKLCRPRKPITAHVWLVPESADDVEACMIDWLTPERLATGRSHLNLPVLGVPGWSPANEAAAFYDDIDVFRPRSRKP